METYLVANSILEKSFKSRRKLNQTQLQNLTYLVNYFYHTKHGANLIEECLEGSNAGLVYSSLSKALRGYGNLTVDEYILHDGVAYVVNYADKCFWKVLSRVWADYSRFYDYELVAAVSRISSGEFRGHRLW